MNTTLYPRHFRKETMFMKLIGNLAVVCAKRPDVLLQVYDGMVSVYVNFGPERTYTAKLS